MFQDCFVIQAQWNNSPAQRNNRPLMKYFRPSIIAATCLRLNFLVARRVSDANARPGSFELAINA